MNTARHHLDWRAGARSLDDRAVAALALGAIGLFLFNIAFGPIAIGLGAAAATRRHAGTADRVAGLIGVALGVADLAVLAVLTINQMRGGGLSWPL